MRAIKQSSFDDYTRIYDRLWAETAMQVRTSRGDEAEPTATDLAQNFYAKAARPDLYSLSTLKKYKTALVAMLPLQTPEGWAGTTQALQTFDVKSALAEAEANRGSIEPAPDEVSIIGRTGSRMSQRMIPEEDFRPLIKNLEYQPDEEGVDGSIWRKRAALALRASVASGCRPIEWLGAHWADQEAGVLRIYTAKQKIIQELPEHLRDIPPLTFIDAEDELAKVEDKERWKEIDALVRENEFSRKIIFLRALDIPAPIVDLLISVKSTGSNVAVFRDVVIDADSCGAVEQHLQAVKTVMQHEIARFARLHPGADVPVEEIYKAKYADRLRTTIWRVCKRTFLDERLYSLADCRSTFAANRKALAGLKAAAMAMGHAWPQTTRDFYAPARKAWSRYANAGPRMIELAQESLRLVGQAQAPTARVPSAQASMRAAAGREI